MSETQAKKPAAKNATPADDLAAKNAELERQNAELLAKLESGSAGPRLGAVSVAGPSHYSQEGDKLKSTAANPAAMLEKYAELWPAAKGKEPPKSIDLHKCEVYDTLGVFDPVTVEDCCDESEAIRVVRAAMSVHSGARLKVRVLK